MTSLTESSTDTAQDTQNAATAVSENLIEHPRGAEPGKPGRRDAFYFEQKNRLPDAADGKGRGGARYGRTGIIHTPHGDIHTPAFVPVATQVRPIFPVLEGISGSRSTIFKFAILFFRLQFPDEVFQALQSLLEVLQRIGVGNP